MADDATDDAFLGGALQVLQPARGYRAGIDAVVLAASATVAEGETVLDAGAGVGVVGLCIARRRPGVQVTLVEREPAYAALARANVARNDLATRVRVVETAIGGALSPELVAGSYHQVVANPPYQVAGRGRRPPDDLKAAAHEMPEGGLDVWARFAARMCRPDGSFTVIHRADALAEVLAALERRFGGIVVKPVHPRRDEPAVRVLVRGIKGSRAPLTLAPPLVLHEANDFTATMRAILRDGAALDLMRG